MDGDGTKSRRWFCVVMEAGYCQACLSKRPHAAQRTCKAVPSPSIKICGIYQICVTIFQRTRGRKEKGVEQTAFMRGMVMVEVRNKRFFTLSGVSSLGPGHKPFTLNHEPLTIIRLLFLRGLLRLADDEILGIHEVSTLLQRLRRQVVDVLTVRTEAEIQPLDV